MRLRARVVPCRVAQPPSAVHVAADFNPPVVEPAHNSIVLVGPGALARAALNLSQMLIPRAPSPAGHIAVGSCWRPTHVPLRAVPLPSPERDVSLVAQGVSPGKAPEKGRESRRDGAILGILCLLLSCAASASDLRISVLSLFHPTTLTLTAAPGATLTLTAGNRTLLLDDSHSARLRLVGNAVQYTVAGETITASSIRSRPGDFTLAVPGKLTRRFHGALEVRPADSALLSVVTMDLELAVASAVAAESPPGASLEALKAQAVVSRTYYAAGSRHRGFDFCDTTHCQFLREPPATDSQAAHAADVTRGLVLSYRGTIFPAMYSARCGGRTRTLAEIGLRPSVYPYFAVTCEFCLRHPEPGPALNYGPGHGVGLCQRGAAGMAASGSTFQEILSHYYPNAALTRLPAH